VLYIQVIENVHINVTIITHINIKYKIEYINSLIIIIKETKKLRRNNSILAVMYIIVIYISVMNSDII